MTNSSGFFRCLAICTVALFHAPPLIANDNNDGELLTERAFQSTVSRKVITPAFSLDSAKIAFALVPKDVLASDDSVIDVFNIHEFRCAERIVVTGSFLTEMAFVGHTDILCASLEDDIRLLSTTLRTATKIAQLHGSEMRISTRNGRLMVSSLVSRSVSLLEFGDENGNQKGQCVIKSRIDLPAKCLMVLNDGGDEVTLVEDKYHQSRSCAIRISKWGEAMSEETKVVIDDAVFGGDAVMFDELKKLIIGGSSGWIYTVDIKNKRLSGQFKIKDIGPISGISKMAKWNGRPWVVVGHDCGICIIDISDGSGGKCIWSKKMRGPALPTVSPNGRWMAASVNSEVASGYYLWELESKSPKSR